MRNTLLAVAIATICLLPSAAAEPEPEPLPVQLCPLVTPNVHYYLPAGIITTQGGSVYYFQATQMVALDDWVGYLVAIAC